MTDERTRIARELHDVVGHTLSLMVLQAGAERLALGSDRPTTREALVQIEQAGRSTLTELRRLVGVLRRDDDEPELAPRPGLDRVGELVDHVRQTGLAVDLQIVGRQRALPPGLDVSAYRIVQEALTNTVKHAHAPQPPASASATASGNWASRSPMTVPPPWSRPRGAAMVWSGCANAWRSTKVELTVGPGTGSGFTVRALLPLGGAG